MAKVPVKVQDNNAHILIEVLGRHGSGHIDCNQITYYVDGELQFKGPCKIMINRRDNYPKVLLLSPVTGDYTDTFQEDSCVFSDLGNLDAIKIER